MIKQPASQPRSNILCESHSCKHSFLPLIISILHKMTKGLVSSGCYSKVISSKITVTYIRTSSYRSIFILRVYFFLPVPQIKLHTEHLAISLEFKAFSTSSSASFSKSRSIRRLQRKGERRAERGAGRREADKILSGKI